MLADLFPSLKDTKPFKKAQTSSDDNTIPQNPPELLEPLLGPCRAVTILIFLLFLAIFFSILIEKMVDEEPTIKISYDESPTSVPLPNLNFTSNNNFSVTTVNCILNSDCNDTIFFDNSHTNNSWFLPNGKITRKTGQAYTFYIFNNGSTVNDLITLTVYDPRTSSYENPPDYVDSFIKQSTYYLVTETDRIMSYKISFRIKQRQDMDNSFLTKIGVTPNYDHKTFYYIESGIQKEIAEPFGVIYKLYEFKSNHILRRKADIDANRDSVWKRATRR
ncbi:10644_t:CDS:2 [Gigaspora rosea]|nr:10644_t:CDS:2 [Gigaspora rosea]